MNRHFVRSSAVVRGVTLRSAVYGRGCTMALALTTRPPYRQQHAITPATIPGASSHPPTSPVATAARASVNAAKSVPAAKPLQYRGRFCATSYSSNPPPQCRSALVLRGGVRYFASASSERHFRVSITRAANTSSSEVQIFATLSISSGSCPSAKRTIASLHCTCAPSEFERSTSTRRLNHYACVGPLHRAEVEPKTFFCDRVAQHLARLLRTQGGGVGWHCFQLKP